MKTYKTVQIPARLERVEAEVYCDFCGEQIVSRGMYLVDDVTIQHEKGTDYPEDVRATDITAYDCCAKCFKEVIEPRLKELMRDRK